jgi:ATP-dependent Clp protease ATP-binding subunit ClpA
MEEELLFDENEGTAKKYSIIERYGEDMTKNTYVTNPAIARDEEIKKMIPQLMNAKKENLERLLEEQSH